jgi:hypothetical protein
MNVKKFKFSSSIGLKNRSVNTKVKFDVKRVPRCNVNTLNKIIDSTSAYKNSYTDPSYKSETCNECGSNISSKNLGSILKKNNDKKVDFDEKIFNPKNVSFDNNVNFDKTSTNNDRLQDILIIREQPRTEESCLVAAKILEEQVLRYNEVWKKMMLETKRKNNNVYISPIFKDRMINSS